MLYNAHAKINLALDIIDRRHDGYHQLESVMQTVRLCDVLKIEPRESGIAISCTDKSIPTDAKNTCHKAAGFFFEKTGIKAGVSIEITKKIPSEAGLGGASADAAAVLRALDRIYNTNLGDALFAIAAKVGADVPFCLAGGAAFCEGTGEVMSPLKSLRGCHIVIVKPPEGISTAASYARFAALRLKPKPCEARLCAAAMPDTDAVSKHLFNALFEVCSLPAVAEIRRRLVKEGALGAQMTGSGSAVFGLFTSRTAASRAALLLDGMGQIFVTEPWA